jgi:ferric-dicitrate binding protein FerR (iron transport regulator)
LEISDSLKEVIIGFYEGNLTQAQADELLDWVNQNQDNLKYLRQLGEIWLAAGILQMPEVSFKKAHKTLRNKIIERGLRNLPRKEIHLPVSALWKTAAVLLILVSLGIAGRMFFAKDTYQTGVKTTCVQVSVPKGSRSFITLPDSTSVWLNADTKFRYPADYGTDNRTVFLDGEAYFKVSRNKELPFRVSTSGIIVTALGTAFNVKAFSDEETIETTLVEGRIRIEEVMKAGTTGPVKAVILKPKQSAVYQKQTSKITVPGGGETEVEDKVAGIKSQKSMIIEVNNISDTRLYTSWKDPRWIFKNEKLSSLAPKLERRYDVKIEFMDNSLKDYAFNGTLLEESLEQVLNAIRYTAPIRYEVIGKLVKLYEDKSLIENYKKVLKSDKE